MTEYQLEAAQYTTEAHLASRVKGMTGEMSKEQRDILYSEDVRYYVNEMGMNLKDAIQKARSHWDKFCQSIAGHGYPEVKL